MIKTFDDDTWYTLLFQNKSTTLEKYIRTWSFKKAFSQRHDQKHNVLPFITLNVYSSHCTAVILQTSHNVIHGDNEDTASMTQVIA